MWAQKHTKVTAKSSYVYTAGGRYFVLNIGSKKIKFDSWQSAVKAGWRKVK